MGVDYFQLAEEVLEMLRYIYKKIQNSASKVRPPLAEKFKSQNDNEKCKINFDKWEKIAVVQAFERYAGIKEKELFDHQLFLQKAKKKGYRVDGFSYEEVWSQIYVAEIEPNLGKTTIRL